jgi:hypothetical protein
VKDPMERQNRAMRQALLRQRPPSAMSATGKLRWSQIMTELSLIHDSPQHAGTTKQELFERGAAQLAGLE